MTTSFFSLKGLSKLFPILGMFLLFSCGNTNNNPAQSQTSKPTAAKSQASKAAPKQVSNRKPPLNPPNFRPSKTYEGELKKLTTAEVVQKAKDGTMSILYTKFLNQDGSPLSKEQKSKLNKDQFGKDYYMSQDGALREIKVREKTMDDKVVDAIVRELATNSWRKFPIVDCDCSKTAETLKQVSADDKKRTDTSIRKGIDSTNAVKVISIINNCGFPTMEEVGNSGVNTVWLIFQHVDSGLRAHYYFDMVKSVEDGGLTKEKIALMQDRMMVGQSQKQIFGSQMEFGDLYALEDPENVDKRRKEYKMPPIQDFLDKFDIKFDPKKYK